MTHYTAAGATSVRPALDVRTELGLGAAALRDLLCELFGGSDPAGYLRAVRPLKPPRVYRLEFRADAPWRSVVIKRLAPDVAQRARLVVEEWLPRLGLNDRCARLLGATAEPRGRIVWHVYEDLGDETLAVRPDPERVTATVELVAELHARAVRHPILADVRRHGGAYGIQYFTSNVRDALNALEALEAAGIRAPPADAQLPRRLRERLHALLADVPRRARAFGGRLVPDTLLHGDLWTINVFVDGRRARLVDWDSVGVGPFSYDVSTFLFRFPPAARPDLLARYRAAAARAGCDLPSPPELELLFDSAERARYANRIIWPALALLRTNADWGFPELAEVERWFLALDASGAGGKSG